MAAFNTKLDIANLACQIIGVPRITDFTSTKTGTEINACYDMMREAELRSNLWTFTTRRVMLRAISPNTQVWTPPTYSAGTTYTLGQVVVDASGFWWQSKVNTNLAHTPDIGAYWGRYYGADVMNNFIVPSATIAAPIAPVVTSSVSGILAGATYYVRNTYQTLLGETIGSAETSLLVAGNSVPIIASPPAATGAILWNCYMSTAPDQETLQSAGHVIGASHTLAGTGLVTSIGVPTTAITSYYAGELVNYIGTIYMSLTNNNTAVPPYSPWLSAVGTSTALQILYPIGAGPSNDLNTANVYRLPHGFLRQAPSSPKAGANVWLGVPRGNVREDWVFEGDYFISNQQGPVMLRFVADFVDVPDMDALFCRGLAAAIAKVICQPLTQSQEKMADANKYYDNAIFRARVVDAIEAGPVDPDIDDLITCRR